MLFERISRDLKFAARIVVVLIVVVVVFVGLKSLAGFRPWSVKDGLSLLQAIQWPHAIIIVMLTLTAFLGESLRNLLDRLYEFGWQDGRPTAKFRYDPLKKVQEIENSSGSQKIGVADLKELLPKAPHYRLPEKDQEFGQALVYFLRNGIMTKERLEAFLAATPIFEALSSIYVKELGRDAEKSLDPLAYATWGTSIFTYGLSDEVIAWVVSQLRNSPEYRNKHR